MKLTRMGQVMAGYHQVKKKTKVEAVCEDDGKFRCDRLSLGCQVEESNRRLDQ